VRVVLVGQTGLDLPLRLDPTIELRRVPTAVHAIGEAAEPMVGPEGDEAGAVTVILAPETDPKGDAAEFLEHLRMVRPKARVLRLLTPEEANGTDEGSGATAPGGPYDGTIRFGTPADDVRRLVREVHVCVKAPAAPSVASAPAAAAHVEPACEPMPDTSEEDTLPRVDVGVTPVLDRGVVEIKEPSGRTPAPAVPPPPIGDESALVQALLVGRDLLLPALDLLRRRLQRGDASYSETPGAPGVPVTYHGQAFGFLHASGVSESALAEQASWLGLWLALRRQQEELRQAAFTDDLTGAWNRRYCERFLGTAIAQAGAARSSVTVLFFDIDNFKQYNDRFGHAAGDDILRETVRLLKSVIRPTDRVCRVGGDEFVVIFHEPQGPREAGSRPPSSIGDIATRFQRQICEHRFPKLAEQAPGTLTISGGLATFPWDGRSTTELIERADQLAIQSKLQGKNAITYGPGASRVCKR
jgi:diguanylate cyclase (GGDEF)-like protein